MMPCSALEGGACEAGGPGPHGGFLLLRITTSVRHNWRLLPDTIASERHVQRENPNNLKLAQQTKGLIHNQLVDKAKARLPTFSHNLHLVVHYISLTLKNIYQITTCRLFEKNIRVPVSLPDISMGKSTEPLKKRQYVTAETLT